MTARHKALAGTTLVLALALTGCNGDTDPDPSTSDSSTTASASSSASGSSSSAPASGSSGSSSSGSSGSESSESAAPEFEPVTSERPKDAQVAQIKGFEALQQHYEVLQYLNTENRVDKDLLAITMRDPYLSKFAEQMAPIESSGETYSGESKIELIKPIIGSTTNAKGEQTPHATAQLLVCEDNTGVVVKDKDGKRVSSGSVLRYEITYLVTWREDDQTWKVVSREVMRDEKDEPKTC